MQSNMGFEPRSLKKIPVQFKIITNYMPDRYIFKVRICHIYTSVRFNSFRDGGGLNLGGARWVVVFGGVLGSGKVSGFRERSGHVQIGITYTHLFTCR
jgi:hypothetical protein